jgi:hypothetical protein
MIYLLGANPRIRFTLGSHVRFGNLDFLCTGVDYDLVLLPPSIDVDTISEDLSSLRLCNNEGQALENDSPGSSQGKTTQVGKLHDHGMARGQSLTTVHPNPSTGEIPTDLPTHHAQAIVEVLTNTETASSTDSNEDDDSWADADFSELTREGCRGVAQTLLFLKKMREGYANKAT